VNLYLLIQILPLITSAAINEKLNYNT